MKNGKSKFDFLFTKWQILKCFVLGTFHRAKTLKIGRACALIQASQFDDHCRTVIFKVRPHTYDCLYFTSLYDK